MKHVLADHSLRKIRITIKLNTFFFNLFPVREQSRLWIGDKFDLSPPDRQICVIEHDIHTSYLGCYCKLHDPEILHAFAGSGSPMNVICHNFFLYHLFQRRRSFDVVLLAVLAAAVQCHHTIFYNAFPMVLASTHLDQAPLKLIWL